jgi:DNA invertase Pin-like site-specific DNA recombinase
MTMTTTKLRTWGYGRVSTNEQTTSNQRLELEQAGHTFDDRRWYADEGVSGAVPAMQRPRFAKLVEKLGDMQDEDYRDVLVVAKLDRLGRDALDVQSTVRLLAAKGVGVRVLNLGETDLTTPAGKLLLTMLSAVAEMERDLLVERTQAGLARAKAEGKTLGRPSKTNDAEKAAIRERLAKGDTVSSVATAFKLSRATVISIRETA